MTNMIVFKRKTYQCWYKECSFLSMHMDRCICGTLDMLSIGGQQIIFRSIADIKGNNTKVAAYTFPRHIYREWFITLFNSKTTLLLCNPSYPIFCNNVRQRQLLWQRQALLQPLFCCTVFTGSAETKGMTQLLVSLTHSPLLDRPWNTLLILKHLQKSTVISMVQYSRHIFLARWIKRSKGMMTNDWSMHVTGCHCRGWPICRGSLYKSRHELYCQQ